MEQPKMKISNRELKNDNQMYGEDFFGQENSKKVIFTMIEAAKKRREQPGHILLYGPEDSGKKYFADIIYLQRFSAKILKGTHGFNVLARKQYQ